jgi:hypothetical protein
MRIITAGDNADVSHNSIFTALWSYVECALGVIVACTLSFPKLYRAKQDSKISQFLAAVMKKLSLKSYREKSNDSLPHLSEIRLPSGELQRWESDSKRKDSASNVEGQSR